VQIIIILQQQKKQGNCGYCIQDQWVGL